MNRSRSRSHSPRLALVLALAGLLAGGAAAGDEPLSPSPTPGAKAAPGAGAAGAATGRVVVLGFDGADARTARELMEADPARYPTLRRLSEQGTFAPLNVVVPAESPVSWASLNSGMNPAKTGVPGFIRRTYAGDSPIPGFGYIEKKDGPLADFEARPWWADLGPLGLAASAGGVVFLATLLLFGLLTRKLPLALILGLVLGGGAAWVAHGLPELLPQNYPRTYNVCKVDSFWDVAARAGVPCTVLGGAESFDAPETPGARVLNGLGLPDARGDLGQWFIYTSNPSEFEREGKATSTAGTIFRVDEDQGRIEAQLRGPANFWLVDKLKRELQEVNERLSSPTTSPSESSQLSATKTELDQRLKEARSEPMTEALSVRLEGDRAHVKIGEREQTLAVGEWSDFFDVTFELNWMLKIHAVTRVRLVQLQPWFELFVDVLNIDPRQPPFWQPISTPFDFAAGLAADCGLYETYGWPTLTMPFKDEKITPELMLEDVEFTEAWRERLTHASIDEGNWRLLWSVFSTTDRVQHMTYQFYDPEHPLYDAAAAAREMDFFGERIRLSQAIPAIYRQMDRIIGDVLAKLEPEDTLFVVSDHGFQSFRRQVHLNNWLAEQGYLKMKPLTKDNRSFLGFVDWSQTRAYALGLGFIYLNLEGREPRGIVSRDEARELMDEIRAKLLASVDPDNGEKVCGQVFFPRDIHQGEFLGLEADIVPGFNPPYRVGWSTSSGGVSSVTLDGLYQPGPFVSDNDQNWSGDHVSMDPDQVQGVFLCNRPVKLPAEGVRALQIAPTALTLLGVPVPAEMDLPALEFE